MPEKNYKYSVTLHSLDWARPDTVLKRVIEKVEILSETPKTVVLPKYGRSKKRTSDRVYCDTLESAIAELKTELLKRVEAQNRRIQYARELRARYRNLADSLPIAPPK